MDFLFLQLLLTWVAVPVKLVVAQSLLETLARPTAFHKHASERILCTGGIIDRNEGIIISPLYPNQYPNHVSCTWYIINNLRDAVTIRFHDLDIEESGTCETPPCCDYNWVKIGPSLNGTEKQFCGQNIVPSLFLSYASKIWIKFHISRIINGGRGFKLFFTIGKRKSPFCRSGDFVCENSECIPRSARCNGFTDCSDGSDERFCSGLCPSGKSCRSIFLCYSDSEHCDGIVNCPDFSDEVGCGFCSANETLCGIDSHECYNPLIQRCNRILDCSNGADEKDCLHGCPGQIMCASGIGCYSSEERCNGITQCSDSSDEKNCGADLCNYDRGGFLCGNGHCIREIWKCDRTNDCGDGSDEHNCLRNSVVTAAVIGSLICGLLLVIAVSCTCRLYALRSYENRMLSDREAILPHVSQEFLFREPPPSYAVSVGEHQRNLCIENVHYNPCARRSRRRIRRARRLRDSRRPPMPGAEGGRSHENQANQLHSQNSQFPCSPAVPSFDVGPPASLSALQRTGGTFHSGPPVVTGEMSTGNTDHSPQKSSEGEKEQDSNDAESSFSEISPKTDEPVSNSIKLNTPCRSESVGHAEVLPTVAGKTFQSQTSPQASEIVGEHEGGTLVTLEICDNDRVQLLS